MKHLLLTLLISSSLLFISCGNDKSSANADTSTNSTSSKVENTIPDKVTSSPSIEVKAPANSSTLSLTDTDNTSLAYISSNDILYFINSDTKKLSMAPADIETPYILKDTIQKEFDYYPGSLASDDSNIYFTNIKDNNSLYKLDKESEEITLVSNNNFSNIILSNNIIYYVDESNNNILCSYNLKNNSTSVISFERLGKYLVNGNYILFQNVNDNNSLYSIKNDGSNEKKITDSSVDSFAVFNEQIIFIDSSNNFFYSYNVAESSTKKLGSFTGTNLRSYNGVYYYIDPSSNHLYTLSFIDNDIDSPSFEVFSNTSTNDYFISDIGIFLNQGIDVNKNHFIPYNE